MEDSEKEVINFYKKRIEPFVAIFILAFMIVGCILLYKDNQLKKDISQNCGWEEEDYKCYCHKQVVDLIILEKENSNNFNLEIENDRLVS